LQQGSFSRFFVARCNGAILLEPAEEILDEMARLVGLLVEFALDFAVALGGITPTFLCSATVSIHGVRRHDRKAMSAADGAVTCALGDTCPDVLEPCFRGKSVVIAKSNRKVQREFDKEAYKARHLIENFFCRLKQYRAIATRYDKTARNSLLQSTSQLLSSGSIEDRP